MTRRLLDRTEIRLCKRYAKLMEQPWRPLVAVMNQVPAEQQAAQIERMEQALRDAGERLVVLTDEDEPEQPRDETMPA